MITPYEIEQQCQKWWRNILISHIETTDFFPKEISRIGKITPRNLMKKLPEYQKSLTLLRDNDKTIRKWGYSLIETEQYFEKIGIQKVPEKIVIETLDDYLKLTKKKTEYQRFLKNYNLIINEIPSLKAWVLLHPQKLIEYDNDIWTDILKVCKYFIANPKPNLYIRELPINVHTKFITRHRGIISELLNHLLPPESINQKFTANDFEKRFYLKYPELTVRFRILDKQIAQTYFSGIDDLCVSISQFEELELPLRRVFVVENKMNIFTFPIIRDSIVIFGSGYSIENLKNIKWLNNVDLFYWGDLDTDGFQILSQFRSYFPQTKSLLMDKETFNIFFENDKGKPSKVTGKLNLTNDEKQLYELLKMKNWRLEQEKIPLTYLKNRLNYILS
ncbi:MAG: DUF2220 family protein [Bacteroidales bacterium]|jgi:hypothetical protein|nr:DUF2220 family protein [Bacteroidales bacterium]